MQSSLAVNTDTINRNPLQVRRTATNGKNHNGFGTRNIEILVELPEVKLLEEELDITDTEPCEEETVQPENGDKSSRKPFQLRENDYIILLIQQSKPHCDRRLMKEEEKKLAIEKDNGSKTAFDILAMSCVRLVINIARNHAHTSSKISLLDLIGSGLEGLCYAVKRFDPNRNIRLVTYATFCITGHILKYIFENNNNFAIPRTSTSEWMGLYNHALEVIEIEGELDPTPDNITHIMKRLIRMKEKGKGKNDEQIKISVSRVDRIKLESLRYVHDELHTIIFETEANDDGNEGEPESIYDIVPSRDPNNRDLTEILSDSVLRKILNEREHDIISLLLFSCKPGLNGDYKGYTAQDIADSYAKSNMTISWIKRTALAKMVLVLRRYKSKGFLDDEYLAEVRKMKFNRKDVNEIIEFLPSALNGK